jgi:hypothetical protein
MTAERNGPPPGVIGFITYQVFSQSVKEDLRYFRNAVAGDFLKHVSDSCGSRKLAIPKGSRYWRARLGYEKGTVLVGDVNCEEYRAYKDADMKPVPHWQNEGRVTPRGIPYLYLATTRDTALAEVRPWVGSHISVAEFEIERDLNVIDCSTPPSKDTLRALGQGNGSYEDGIWAAINRGFAEPVTRDEVGGEYIPTQIIAELFKSEGFDGIQYKSLLSKNGINLALFSLDDASAVPNSGSLYTVDSIDLKFRQYANK